MGCFHVLAIMNNITVNTEVWLSLQEIDFIFFIYSQK